MICNNIGDITGKVLANATPAETRRSLVMRIHGGLGNQMFQYASGLGLARRLGVPLTLDLSWFSAATKSEIDRPFLLDTWMIDATIADTDTVADLRHDTARWRHSLAKRLPDLWVPHLSRALRGPLFREAGHPYQPAATAMRPPVLFDGYFQSERYFAHISDEIRRHFTPRAPLSPTSAEMADAIRTWAWPVSLHIRRGDYVTNTGASQLLGVTPMDYYRAAIAHIRTQRSGMPHFLLFSDDPDWVREAFAFLDAKTVVIGNADRPWDDMTLMALCHDHITANSSFSWWGAWLNPRADKTVIAPKRWFAGGDAAKMSDVDLVPDSWKRF
jgi:hypothetical protein